MSTIVPPTEFVENTKLTSHISNSLSSTPLDVVYITENVISMAFPYDPKSLSSGEIDSGNNINEVSSLLKTKHAGHFMIWNVSEESYDYSLFDNQVQYFSKSHSKTKI
jgi:hypothetical protein